MGTGTVEFVVRMKRDGVKELDMFNLVIVGGVFNNPTKVTLSHIFHRYGLRFTCGLFTINRMERTMDWCLINKPYS